MLLQYNSLLKNSIKKILLNPIGAISFFIISFFLFISIFAYYLIPQNTHLSNQIQLSLAKKPPGFEMSFLLKRNNYVKSNNTFFQKLVYGEKVNYTKIPIAKYSLKNSFVFFQEYIEDDVASNNIQKIHIDELFLDKESIIHSQTFLLGTDRFGRDLLSRIVLGSRVSLSVGFISVIISLLVGLILGLISGYFGGKLDFFIQWLINVVWSIPTLLLVISISLVLGKGFWQVFIAIGLTMWVEVARVTRGEVLKLREQPYIIAVRSLGYSPIRIIFKHIFPNVISPIIIISTANFATAILLESGLSFLGLGIQPPIPSWGTIIKNHYLFILIDNPFMAIFPGFCIVVLVLSFMSLGNVLRDVMDVKIT